MKDDVGIGSPDTFDVLRERTRSLRSRREHVEWSSISIEIEGVPPDESRACGVARVDNSLFRNLAGGMPTSFRVEPGEHTVIVHLSRWLRLPRYRGAWKLSVRVAALPREDTKLVCGLRPGARDEWRMIRITQVRTSAMLGVGSLLIAVFGWFLPSLIGSLLAPAALFIQIRGVWIPQLIIYIALRIAVITWILVPWCLLANRLILAPGRRGLQSLMYQFVYPYYLKKAEEPLHERQPAL